MADEDLTIKARIDDELSRPLENVREKVEDVGEEAERSSRRAGRGSRSWDLYGRATEKAGRLAHTAGRLIRGAAFAVGAGITATAYAAGRLAASSISKASDLNESLNAVNVTYGKQAGAVKKLGREAAKSLGLSNTAYNGMAVQFASFAQVIGGKGPGSVKVLDKITTRAADFASVMNLEVSEATELFQSGLAGESEPLRKYGINLSAAAVQAYALSKGIIEGKEQLTDSQKVQATYGLLMEKTSKTQGDFTNTSDQLANQQRILSARFDNAQAKLGRGLLPVMQTGAKWLNREGIPAFLRFSDWFNDEGLPAIGRFIDKARTFYETHGPQIRSTLADVRDVAKSAADHATDLVDAFVNMPSWARKLLVGGLAGGVTAKKLGLFSLVKSLGKGSGGLLSLATKAKPLPVWVVNKDGLPGDLPNKPKSPKIPPVAATLGIAAAMGVGSDITRRVMTAAVGDELTSAVQTSVYASEGGGGLGAGVFSADDFAASDSKVGKKKRAEVKKQLEALAVVADLGRFKAAGFGDELDLVGARKVKPEVQTDSIKAANDSIAKFIGMQIDAGRPIAPYITINGYAQAMQQIATLTAGIHSIPSAGVDAGLTYVGGGATPPSSPRRRPGGGNPDPVHNTHPRRLTSTLEPRRTGGGAGSTITIHDGAIRVDARNARDTVDVEQGVKRAIEAWMRDREERR